MNEQERYADFIHRLAEYEYTVFLDKQGFVVLHLTDTKDVSHISTFDDLTDFVNRVQWREQRKTEQLFQV